MSSWSTPCLHPCTSTESTEASERTGALIAGRGEIWFHLQGISYPQCNDGIVTCTTWVVVPVVSSSNQHTTRQPELHVFIPNDHLRIPQQARLASYEKRTHCTPPTPDTRFVAEETFPSGIRAVHIFRRNHVWMQPACMDDTGSILQKSDVVSVQEIHGVPAMSSSRLTVVRYRMSGNISI